MVGRLGMLMSVLLATVPTSLVFGQSQQPATPVARWAPPPPCTGDSTETHPRRSSSIVVPDLDSVPILRARVMLARLGLKIDLRSARADGRTGVVIGQSPDAGTAVSSGDAVIVCSRRSPSIPDVVGLTYEAAGKVLADAGYDAVRINSFVDRPARVGMVFRQQPVAGAAVPRGGADTLIVGMAPPIASVVRTPAGQGQPAGTPSRSGSEHLVVQAQQIPPSAPPLPDESMDWSWLWKFAVGAGVVVAAWFLMTRAKDRRRLAAFRVVPRQDPGRAHVVRATRVRNDQ